MNDPIALTEHEHKVLLEFSGVSQDGVFNDSDTTKAIKGLKDKGLLSQGSSCYITNEGKGWLFAN